MYNIAHVKVTKSSNFFIEKQHKFIKKATYLI